MNECCCKSKFWIGMGLGAVVGAVCCHLVHTEQGKEMLGYFGNKISDEIKKEVNEYLTKNKYELKQAANIISEYYRTTQGDYAVHCCIKENGSSLIDLTVSVPDEDTADYMCGKWKDSSQSIYEYIIKQLM